MTIKDLIIVGAGPAGITAAVYAARKRLDFTVVTKDIGGQAAISGDIENYPGYQFITGPELAEKFKEHMEKFAFDLREGVGVSRIAREGANFNLQLSTNDLQLTAKTVIVASGKRSRFLNVPGESEFKNKGVSYCATCDGPLFAGKAVAIIGGGNSALDAALQLIRIASKVHIINITDKIIGDQIMLDKVSASPLVEIHNQTKVTAIYGNKFVGGLKAESAGQPIDLKLEGLFVEIGLSPNSEIIDFAPKNELGEIIVDCAAETSVPGLFAAGDVTSVPEKQIVIAAGEGAKAALAAFKYLSTH